MTPTSSICSTLVLDSNFVRNFSTSYPTWWKLFAQHFRQHRNNVAPQCYLSTPPGGQYRLPHVILVPVFFIKSFVLLNQSQVFGSSSIKSPTCSIGTPCFGIRCLSVWLAPLSFPLLRGLRPAINHYNQTKETTESSYKKDSIEGILHTFYKYPSSL